MYHNQMYQQNPAMPGIGQKIKQPPIELAISCTNLKDRDIISRSDPQVKVDLVEMTTNKSLQHLGMTERVKDNLNPCFTTTIKHVPSKIAASQSIRFKVVDYDPEGNSDDLGIAYAKPEQIMQAGSTGLNMALSKGNGRITIIGYDGVSDQLVFKFRGTKIKSKDGLFGKSDPYLVLLQNGTQLYRTETIDDTKSPNWNGFKISCCRLNLDREIICQVFDKDITSDEIIGQCSIMPKELLQGMGQREFTLCSLSSGKSVGNLILDSLSKEKVKQKHFGMMGTSMGISMSQNQHFTGHNMHQNPYPNAYNQPYGQNQAPNIYPNVGAVPNPGYPPANPGYPGGHANYGTGYPNVAQQSYNHHQHSAPAAPGAPNINPMTGMVNPQQNMPPNSIPGQPGMSSTNFPYPQPSMPGMPPANAMAQPGVPTSHAPYPNQGLPVPGMPNTGYPNSNASGQAGMYPGGPSYGPRPGYPY